MEQTITVTVAHWDGTNYSEAIEKSKRTGKRILYA